MKKLLLTLMVFAVASSAVFAEKPIAVKKQNSNILRTEQAVIRQEVREVSHPYIKAVAASPKTAIQSMKKVSNNIANNNELFVKLSKAPKAVAAHALEGIYNATGTSYFEGAISWLVLVEQDLIDANKFWFYNLIDEAFTDSVYGMLNAASDKISIPANQSAFGTGFFNPPYHNEAGFLVSYDGTSEPSRTKPVEANVDISKGSITFTTGFGVLCWDMVLNTSADYWDIIVPIPAAVFRNRDVVPPAPKSLYTPPVGTLYLGRSEDGYSLNINSSIAPPYSQWTFKNKTEKASANQVSSWQYSDSNNDYSATTTDLVMDVTGGGYTMPTLYTNIGDDETSYTHGATMGDGTLFQGQPVGYDTAYIYAGGGSLTISGSTFNMTNADPDRGTVYYTTGADSYMFGTGSNNSTLKGLISFYDGNPNGMTFIRGGVSVFFGVLSGPANTELNLTIVKANRNTSGDGITLGDTIAVATTTIAKALSLGTLIFDEFYALDEFGFSSPVDYLEMDGSFALILTGYMAPGVTLGVISELVNKADKVRFAYLLGTNGQIYSYTTGYYTMLFSLRDAYYTFLQSEVTKLQVEEAGGLLTVDLKPDFNNIKVGNTLPSWIKVSFDDHFEQGGDWYSTAKINVEANTGDDRSFDIEFSTYGARHTITVEQKGPLGLTTTKASEVKASYNNNSFVLSYTDQFNSVSVYDVAGKQIGTYALPKSGNFSIPASDLTNGVYIVRFAGESNAAVKVVK